MNAAAVPAPASGTDLSGTNLLVNLIPRNPIKTAAEGNMLSLMVFALFFGMAMAVVPREKTRGLTDTLEGIFAVSIKLTDWVLAENLPDAGHFNIVPGTLDGSGSYLFETRVFNVGGNENDWMAAYYQPSLYWSDQCRLP